MKRWCLILALTMALIVACIEDAPVNRPVSVPVAEVLMNRDTIELNVGDTEALEATVLPEEASEKSITWYNADSTVAVFADGSVTALGIGETVISAASGGKSDSCIIKVLPVAVDSVMLDMHSLVLQTGSSDTLSVTVLPEDATERSVVWSVADSAIASVSCSGTVMALSVGKTLVYAKSGEKLDSCIVEVAPIPVASVTLDLTRLELIAGDSAALTATLLPENASDRSILWSSSDIAVAEVKDGVVRALAAGDAVISAEAGEQVARCTVEVERKKQNVYFESSDVKWFAGVSEEHDVGCLYAMPQTLQGAETEVVYSLSDTSVAEINGNLISIKGSGTTTVTAVAIQTGQYHADSASYTFTAVRTDLFNLENPSVCAYLDFAKNRYNDRNYGAVCVVDKYCANSASDRKDIPGPAKVYWQKSYAEAPATVKVYSDPAMEDEVADVTTTADTAEIYNLVPGETYYYKVSEEGAAVKTGRFSTYGRCRMIKISDSYGAGCANNCRDLGGLRTTDGHTIRYGLLYRGSNMDATTVEEKRYITDFMGVKTDIDLRDGAPSAVSTTSLSGVSGCNRPFYDKSWGVSYVYAGFSTFDDLVNAAKLKTIFNGIINSVIRGKPCYIHCAAGADRTGFICMLLEAALGVSFGESTIDYELTSFSCVGLRTRNGGYGDLHYSTGRRYITRYGTGTFCENAEKILLDAGITQSQLSAFRRVMLQ